MTTNINIVTGKDYDLVINATDDANSVINLDNISAITFNLKKEGKATSDITKDLADGIVKTDSPNGQITITLTSADTNSLPVGDYIFEVVMVDTNGKNSNIRNEDFSFPSLKVVKF